MYRRFVFEGDIHETLELIPLVIRRKLDLAAWKLSLEGWQSFSRAERLALCHLPVDTAEDVAIYREVLQGLAERAHTSLDPLHGPAPTPSDWRAEVVVTRLRDRLGEQGPAVEAAIVRLGEEERYALFKLTEPKRSTDRLKSALAELGLSV